MNDQNSQKSMEEYKADAEKWPLIKAIYAAKDAVIGRYSNVFKPENIDKIDKDILMNFFRTKYNGHWRGLQRQNNIINDNIDEIRRALKILLDEGQDIETRITCVDQMLKGKGVGHSKYTPILHVAHPEKYGVWNGLSEKGLRYIERFPESQRGQSTGEKYKKINGQLNDIAKEIGVSLWDLDAIWLVVGEVDMKKLDSPTLLKHVTYAANRN